MVRTRRKPLGALDKGLHMYLTGFLICNLQLLHNLYRWAYRPFRPSHVRCIDSEDCEVDARC